VSASAGRQRWLYAAPLLALLHGALLATLHARPGLAAVVLWHIGPITLTTAAIAVMAYGLLRSRRARLTWTAKRTAGYVTLLAVAALPLAYRTYPSSRDDAPSEVAFRLPLDGPVLVAWGGPTRDVNYHAKTASERWAYDLTVAGDRRPGDGRELSDYAAFGLPVLAPADGVVVHAVDGWPDGAIGFRLVERNPCGNTLVLEVAPGEFLFLCHLQEGSIAVAPGDRVEAGQPLARVGNSGRSTEPHVHVHLQTTASGDLGEGIPMYFHGYRHEGRLVERGMPTGGRRPQVIEHAEAEPEGWP
jgi:murein DD-endopeptidase MepM/ murein hydrolase activator NlpD